MVRERNIDWLPLARVPTRDPARNPGMCSDWELNLQQFGLQDHAQPSAPCWSGHIYSVYREKSTYKWTCTVRICVVQGSAVLPAPHGPLGPLPGTPTCSTSPPTPRKGSHSPN